MKGPQKESPFQSFFQQFKKLWPTLAFMIFFLLFLRLMVSEQQNHIIAYSELKEQIKLGLVQELTFRGKEIVGTYHSEAYSSYQQKKQQQNDQPTSSSTNQTLPDQQRENIASPFMSQKSFSFESRVPPIEDPALIPLLEEKGVKIKAQSEDGPWAVTLFFNLLPWLLIFGFFYYSSKRFQKNMGDFSKGGFPFQTTKAKLYTKSETSLTFEDVAGLEDAKTDLKEIVDFLKFPEKYKKMGAKLPKGVLLMGPPGTGKTLLAKATAGEANVPFFSINGSEFIEIFVGVGAARVRDLFENARKEAPSVIFIDEIDSIGRARGTGLGGGHDEREQTLNQILSAMDGFDPESPVVVMAATNRPDVLDPALIRPGRFDRQITMQYPHKEARKKIFNLHLKKVPIDETVDQNLLAASTAGFSGADIRNLVNEAALLAARTNRLKVTLEDFEQARDKILLGNKREDMLTEEDRRIVAFHESGHALVAYLLPGTDPLRKVSIIPRGRALGATEQIPLEDRLNLSKSFIENQIAILLGGRIAERLTFNEITTGAEDDLKKATKLARRMVANWGMSERLGSLAFQQGEEHHFLGKEIMQPKDFSEKTAELIDDEVFQIISHKEREVTQLLKNHQTQLEKLAHNLLIRESLSFKEIKEILEEEEPQVVLQ